MTVIRHLKGNQPYTYTGRRVLVTWNPEIHLWIVYDLNTPQEQPLFSTGRLELHAVGNYGEMKTKFAPHGSPTFIGTIVVESLMETGDAGTTRVTAHPHAPSKTFFATGPNEHEPFDQCRRLLLDGYMMTADRRVKHS